MNSKPDDSLAPHASVVAGGWTVWLGQSTGGEKTWSVSLETGECYFAFDVDELAALVRAADAVADWLLNNTCGSMVLGHCYSLPVELYRDDCAKTFHIAMPDLATRNSANGVSLKFDAASAELIMNAFRGLAIQLRDRSD